MFFINNYDQFQRNKLLCQTCFKTFDGFLGSVVETIGELERYNETIGCHYKLADQRRQSCQERQKLGAAADNCNRCIFTEYSVFLLYFLKGGVHNDLISDHGLLSETFDQNEDET